MPEDGSVPIKGKVWLVGEAGERIDISNARVHIDWANDPEDEGEMTYWPGAGKTITYVVHSITTPEGYALIAGEVDGEG